MLMPEQETKTGEDRKLCFTFEKSRLSTPFFYLIDWSQLRFFMPQFIICKIEIICEIYRAFPSLIEIVESNGMLKIWRFSSINRDGFINISHWNGQMREGTKKITFLCINTNITTAIEIL